MLADIGHPFAEGEPVYDVTFENVQAGLRTDYLFRLANQHGGFVSAPATSRELALGWCTYGVGDQMSHYNVNAGVPKTLIQHLIRWVIATRTSSTTATDAMLLSILATEISPELVPAEAGEAPQSTEARSAPTSCRTSTSSTSLASACGRPRSPSWRWHAWRDVGHGRLAARLPDRGAQRLRPGRRSGNWLEVFLCPLLRVQPVQALGDAQRAQGLGRRRASPARRLARAVGFERGGMA